MQIGTARPLDAELQGVPHYFLGNTSIDTPFNAGDYEREALTLLDSLFAKQENVVLCGGTGLYINALCNGLDAFPEVTEAIKNEVHRDFEAKGFAFLQAELAEKDPDYYREADINNLMRVRRAVEVCRASGKPYSSFKTQQAKKRAFSTLKIGINWEKRADLYHRIENRMDIMLENGLLDEVKSLYEKRQLSTLNTVGYSEFFDFLDGKTDFNTAKILAKQHSRNYAKRQLTWFRRDEAINWFAATPDLIAKVLAFL
ncbi:MAG: tRNA ((37)-N6)-dimethylallyltransferase MiaA [Bacteroidota bacterium]